MLDLSPEKLTMLLAVGLVVLGPEKLPAAARTMAHAMVRARRLASTLTGPIDEALGQTLGSGRATPGEPTPIESIRRRASEPAQAVRDVVADLRSTIASHPLPTAAAPAVPDPPGE